MKKCSGLARKQAVVGAGFVQAMAIGALGVSALSSCDVPAGKDPEPLRVWEQPLAVQAQLAGQVLEITTGAPVPEASIEPQPQGGSGPVPSTRTSGDGSFALDLPVGRSRVLVKRAGFLTGGRELAISPTRTEAIFRLLRAGPFQDVGAAGGTLRSGAASLAVPPGAYVPRASVSVTHVPRDQIEVLPGAPQYTDDENVPRRIVGAVAISSSMPPGTSLTVTIPVPADVTEQNVKMVGLADDGQWKSATAPMSVSGGDAVFEVPGDGTYGVAVDTTVADAPNVGYVVTQPGDGAGLKEGQVVKGGTKLEAGKESITVVDPHGSTVEITPGSAVILDAPEGEMAATDAGAPAADAGAPATDTGPTVRHAGHLTVVRGRAKVCVAKARSKDAGRYRLHVKTSIGRYRVKGTSFAVSTCVAAGHATDVLEVFEGTVEMEAGSEVKDVKERVARTLCSGCAGGTAPACPGGPVATGTDGGGVAVSPTDGPSIVTPPARLDGPPAPRDAGTPPDLAPPPPADGPAPTTPDGSPGLPEPPTGLPEPPSAMPDTGVPPPPPAQLVVDPAALTFGAVIVGDSSGSMDVTVRNTGGSPSAVLAVDTTGDFAVSASDCGGASLAPGATCAVAVRFTATDTGLRTGSLNVTESGGAPVTASLTGMGLLPPMLIVTPTRVDFGARRINTTSPERSFTVRNGGGAPSAMLEAAIAGAEFRISSGDCPATLAAGATCTVGVVFAPTSGGNKMATLAVTGSGGRAAATLVGAGTVPTPRLALTPTTHAFGNVVVGTESPRFDFTVSNLGDATSGMVAITLGGNNPGEFRIAAGPCVQPLTAGSTCTFGVFFRPTPTAGATGARSAVLQIAGTPGGTDTSTLTGNATTPGITISPTSADYGNVMAMSKSPPQRFVITNPGAAAIPALTLAVSGEFVNAENSCSGGIPAMGNCIVDVVFAPLSAGAKTGTLTATASTGATAAATLKGTATAAAAARLAVFPAGRFACQRRLTLNVLNGGNANSGPITFALSGSTSFVITSDRCAGTSLTVDNNCSFDIVYQGSVDASATLTVNGGATPVTVPLTVTGDAGCRDGGTFI